jgi:predicted dehydrogenase
LSIKLKAAVAGYGKMGKIRIQSLINNVHSELGHVYDPALKNDFTSEILQSESFEDLLETDCNAIFIAGYVSHAADYTIKALNAGKHVFCEKPPAISLAELDLVGKALKNSGKILKYGFNHRYHFSIIKAKEIIDSGVLGKILFMRGVYGKAGSLDFKDNWRNYRNYSGGGILMDQGIHMLDLFNFFSNAQLQAKMAVVKTLHWDIECEDNVMAVLESPEGLMCSLHSTATQWRHKFGLEIVGENGYIELDGILSSTMSYAPEKLIFGLRREEDLRISMGHPPENIFNFDADESWNMELDEFILAIDGISPIVNGTLEHARAAIKLVEEIYSFA